VTEELQQLIDKARDFATKVHEGQFRFDKVTPYIKHPEAVANAVADDDKTVAWLHDVIEDAADPDAALAELRSGFPAWVVDAVLAMTKRDGDDYEAYIARVKANQIARRVKVADIGHNLDGKCSPKRRTKYLNALAELEKQ
jgi:(p)ppGpp synthase/HD superfamily hydrolase